MKLRRDFELWGYPGAGKSSLARRLKAQGAPVRELLPFRACALSPVLTVATLWERPDLIPGFVRSSYRWSDAEAKIARMALRQAVSLGRRPSGMVEEGIVHEIWRAAYESPRYRDAGKWRRFLDLAGPHIVLLELDPSEAKERMLLKVRPGPVNRELMASTLSGEAWERAENAFTTILSALEEMPTIEVHRVRVSGKSLEQTADEIGKLMDGIG